LQRAIVVVERGARLIGVEKQVDDNRMLPDRLVEEVAECKLLRFLAAASAEQRARIRHKRVEARRYGVKGLLQAVAQRIARVRRRLRRNRGADRFVGLLVAESKEFLHARTTKLKVARSERP